MYTPGQYKLEDMEVYEKKRWWLGLTIGDIFDKNAALYPNREALVGGGKRYTFSELKDVVDRMAYGMIQQGFRKGDRIMLQLPNVCEFVIACNAIEKAGLTMVLLTVNHTAKEVAHIAKLTDAKGWILPSEYRGRDFLPLIEEIQQEVADLEKIYIYAEDGTSQGGYAPLSDLYVENVDESALEVALAAARPDPRDVCYLLPSGGTTNLPKCAVRTHNDYLCNVEYKSRAWCLGASDISLVATTVGHNLALLVSISGAAFHGGKLVMLDSTRAEDICRAIEEEKVTCASLVPTLASRLANYENLGDYELSSLKKMYVGAANSPPELVQRIEDRIGCRYVNAFGMVEGPCSQTRLEDSLEIRCNTIGRPVCPYDDFKTFNEAGKPTAAGVEGELVAKGPGIFSGYFKNDQANATAFTPEGYFRTGDLAVIESSGLIRITGRIKDIIIRGGENIAARDVEDLVSAHSAVEYVAAIGMPHADLGESVCIYVKAVDGKSVSRDEIVTHMVAMGATKILVPDRVEVVDAIPLTAAGKADKKLLRKMIVDVLENEK